MMFMWMSTLISLAWLAWSSQVIHRYIIVNVRVHIYPRMQAYLSVE
jgi:hypothetical protein